MKSFQTLPEGYAQIFRVDLQKNKKQAYLVNGAAVGITLVMFLIGRALVPFAVFFDISGGMKPFFIRVLALVAGTVGYVLLHELIHAIVMKLCGTEKVKLGFSGGYFYAGSRDYYPKAPYFCIALAPVVILGVILLAACFAVSAQWFWVLYFIQISNISGAVGDIYVVLRFAPMPADILIRDHGTSMRVYSKEELPQ